MPFDADHESLRQGRAAFFFLRAQKTYVFQTVLLALCQV